MAIFTHIVIGGKDPLKLELLSAMKLKSRVAFVFSTFNSDWIDFIERLCIDLMYAISDVLESEQVTIGNDEDSIAKYRSIEDFAAMRPKTAEVGAEDIHIPLFASFRRGQTTSAIMTCELWNCVGGPWPYSDSYTFSLYLPDDSQLLNVIHEVKAMCSQHALPMPKLVYA